MNNPVQKQNRSRASIYLVTAALGIAFSAVLFVNAWRGVIEDARRNFQVQTASLHNNIAASIRSSDQMLRAITVFAQAQSASQSAISRTQFKQLFEPYPYILAAGLYSEARDWQADAFVSHSGDDYQALERFGLDSDDVRRENFADALANDIILPGVARSAETEFVFLARAVPGKRNQLAVLFIDLQMLLGEVVSNERLGTRLVADSQGLIGRQVLFENAHQYGTGATANRLLELDTRIQFPSYSIALSTNREIALSELDLGPLLIALVIGGGTLLLMLTLAHAKESQARELRQRNAFIEEQVVRQTRELAEARDQALEASRVKSEFLASMSHEIRTPLNAIIGMAELLSETDMNSEQQRYVGVFSKAGEALLALVNDILDLSKIEAHQLELENIGFSLEEVLANSCDIYELKCQEKGVRLSCSVDSAIAPVLMGDPGRIRQVVLNLIGNAIKFTESGEIAVSARTGPGDDTVLVSVRDSGIGIPADKLESIFSSFTQVDSSTTRKYGGTGLGLTISQKLVSMMGGKIWVESEEGAGSTFSFTLALKAGERLPDTVQAPEVTLAELRVLVVDDNETNRLLIEQTLAAQGMIVNAIEDPRQAKDLILQASNAQSPFDLMICDGRMPHVDGFELVRQLRDAGYEPATILMLSSSSLSEELEQARALGVGAHLVKPVSGRDLLAAVRSCHSRRAGKASAPDSAQEKNILLVEDTADNRLLIQAYLKKAPYVIEEAENGQQAVEKIKAGDYDLVLMDVQMPVMDGHTATREIRAWEIAENRQPLPIIALTAHAVREEMDKSIAAGCTAHLTKPIKKKVLLGKLEELLA